MDETELVNGAKIKDEDAFEQLIDTYKPVIERFAYQFGVKQENIPDIVQETFIKIHRKSHQFHKGKFTTWVYQITLNVVRDQYRKQKRDRKLIDKAR